MKLILAFLAFDLRRSLLSCHQLDHLPHEVEDIFEQSNQRLGPIKRNEVMLTQNFYKKHVFLAQIVVHDLSHPFTRANFNWKRQFLPQVLEKYPYFSLTCFELQAQGYLLVKEREKFKDIEYLHNQKVSVQRSYFLNYVDFLAHLIEMNALFDPNEYVLMRVNLHNPGHPVVFFFDRLYELVEARQRRKDKPAFTQRKHYGELVSRELFQTFGYLTGVFYVIYSKMMQMAQGQSEMSVVEEYAQRSYDDYFLSPGEGELKTLDDIKRKIEGMPITQKGIEKFMAAANLLL